MEKSCKGKYASIEGKNPVCSNSQGIREIDLSSISPFTEICPNKLGGIGNADKVAVGIYNSGG